MQCILAINSSTDYNAKIFDPRKRTHTIFSWLYICICQFFLKSNRKDVFTALIMMLSQVQATMPAHDQLWIKCHTMHYPRRFVICVYRTQKKHILTHKGLYVFWYYQKNTLNEQFGVFVVLSDIRSMTENCPKDLFCSWVFMNDIVDATVIWVERDT